VPVVAVLVGLQASGKTTFCQRMLGPGFVVVSKAHFRHARHPQRRQMHLVEEALSTGRDVVVDNTNPSPQEWAPLIDAARAHGARVIAYWFPPDLAGSLQRNAARPDEARIPEIGLRATLARLLRPRVQDGFDEVFAVEFDGAGGFIVRHAGEDGEDGEPACGGGNGPVR
jgi:predicted kinase